jgi:hypothetical protein
MSISAAQAAFLSEGLADSLGSDKDGFRPTNTLTELQIIAGSFIEACQKNLENSHNNASGALSESLTAGDPVVSSGKVRIDILMNDYGLFVNSGVKGTRSGSSTAGYSFKSDHPGSKFIKSIEDWIKIGKLSSSNVKQSYGGNERKSKSISQISSAFAVARSIMQKGLKGNGFLDKAEQTTSATVEDRLGKALEIDIITALTK